MDKELAGQGPPKRFSKKNGLNISRGVDDLVFVRARQSMRSMLGAMQLLRSV